MTFIATYRSALYAEDSNEFYLPHTEIQNWQNNGETVTDFTV